MDNRNLIERLGAEYCGQRMQGTLFNYDGNTYEFSHVEGKEVVAIKYTGKPEKVSTSVDRVPADIFQSWKALSWPVLGYRQAAGGQFLARVGRRGSVQRGLHKDSLQVTMHPVCIASAVNFRMEYDYFRRGEALIMMAMQPQYTKFSEGVQQVMKGAIPAFAVSADFAVAPNEQVPFLEVLFRGRRIGEVSETGDVTITAEGIRPSWNAVTAN
jgi:hypothetical protein